MRFLTMWYVRLAKSQISLRIRAVWSEHLLVDWIFYGSEAADWTLLTVSKLKSRLHRLVWVYISQNATLLEITYFTAHICKCNASWFHINYFCHTSYAPNTFGTVLTWFPSLWGHINNIYCIRRFWDFANNSITISRVWFVDIIIKWGCYTQRNDQDQL